MRRTRVSLLLFAALLAASPAALAWSALGHRLVGAIAERHLDPAAEAQVRALLDYCGLPFDARCLRFFENPRAVRTASSEQVRQPIYREGVDHWRHYEAWLEPLKQALGPVLDAYPQAPHPLVA